MPTPTVVPDRLVAQMLEFGRLLQSNSGARRRPGDELIRKAAAEEENLALAIETSKVDALRDVFGFNKNGTHTDSLTLRIVCVVAYAELAGTLALEVRAICQTVCLTDDLLEPLRARQTVFRLCVRRYLSVAESYGGKQQIRCGQPLLDLFRGSSKDPLFFTGETVKQFRQEQEVAKKNKGGKGAWAGVKTAKQIYAELDKYITGQRDLKIALSIAARHALLRREMKILGKNGRLPPRPNMLILGPSGTGKTYTCQTLSRLLGIPYAEIDCSTCTASGYVGDDLAGVLYLLSESAAEMGVRPEDGGLIYLDEIDKLATSHYTSPTTVGVQFEMLKLLGDGGGTVSYPLSGTNKWGSSGGVMDTSNLMVAAGGAFSWLEEDLRGTKTIGFSSRAGAVGRAAELRALLATKGGLIPELVNRFSAIIRNDPLSPAEIATIATAEHGPLAEYRAALAAEGRGLAVDQDAALLIGEWAASQGLMGRGPRVAFERILREPLFSGTPKEVRISRAIVQEALMEGQDG